MALGWEDVQRMKRVEEKANKLGFQFAAGQYGYSKEASLLVLKPLGDALPHYGRNAELFSGSIESIDTWLNGLLWAREYDNMLKISNDKKRDEKEQAEKNKQLMKTIKTGKKVEGKMGQHDDDEVWEDDDDEYDEDIVKKADMIKLMQQLTTTYKWEEK